ncbi:MAG: hypothetical protein NTW21_30875, partial [Verrucomicrobia bacterium]|nr:hypothetical protein [Verrucomicrobiota bacterium]
YQIQLFASGGDNNNVLITGGPSLSVGGGAGGSGFGHYAVGTFTATGSSQVITISGGEPVMNALTIGVIPGSDSTPPDWIAGWPQAAQLTPTSLTVRARSNETGTAYYVVLATGATAPNAAQVKAGTDSTDAPALSGSIPVTANTETTAPVTGLTTGSSYDVYFVAEDTMPNLQASPSMVSVAPLVSGASDTFSNQSATLWGTGLPGSTHIGTASSKTVHFVGTTTGVEFDVTFSTTSGNLQLRALGGSTATPRDYLADSGGDGNWFNGPLTITVNNFTGAAPGDITFKLLGISGQRLVVNDVNFTSSATPVEETKSLGTPAAWGGLFTDLPLDSTAAYMPGELYTATLTWVSIDGESIGLYKDLSFEVGVSPPITAAASTDWHLPATWTPATVPTSITPVIVDSTHAVTITTATADCLSLTLGGSGSVTATGQTLTIASPDISALNTPAGTLLALDATSTLNIAKANTSASLNGLTVSAGSPGTILNITGELTVDASKDLTGATLNTPKVTLAGGSTLTIGTLNVPGGGSLTGTGTLAGTVTVAGGGMVGPGTASTISTIGTSGLTLANGSLLTINAASTSDNDQINVSTSAGLTINGGAITFLNAAGTGPVTGFGTYQIIGYTGAINGAGVSSLTVANKADYTDYSFGTAGGFVTLTLTQGALPVPFLSQNFDTDPVNYTLPGNSSPFRFDTGPRYWAKSDTPGLTVNAGITGSDGAYLGAQNIDGGTVTFSAAAPAQIDFTVAATGYSNLKLSIALAGMPTAENVNFIRAKTDNDGDGTYETTIFNFQGNNNSAYTDATLGALTAAFKTFTYIALPTPTALDGMLRLRLESFNDTDSQNEATGIDSIVIAGMPGGAYDTWAGSYAGGQTAEKDYNHDGVANGVAYFMGMDGLATNPGVIDGKVTWPHPTDRTVASYMVQVSNDLVVWEAAAAGDVKVLTSPDRIEYTLPTGAAKQFCRLAVTP